MAELVKRQIGELQEKLRQLDGVRATGTMARIDVIQSLRASYVSRIKDQEMILRRG